MMGSSQGVKDKPLPIPAWCLGHPHLPAGSVLALLHFAFYPLVCALGLIQLPEAVGTQSQRGAENNPRMRLPLPGELFPWQHKVFVMWLLLGRPSLP